ISYLTPGTAALAAPPDEREAVAATLAVQQALQHGRDLVARGSYETAVHVLEGQLARINGSREYLAVLREAYRGYVKERCQANKDAEAEVYFRRLLILDPGAVLDGNRSAPPPARSAAAPKPPPPEQPRPGPIVRAKGPDPFDPVNSKPYKEACAL